MPEQRCHDPRVEYLPRPIGVGVSHPRFSGRTDGVMDAGEIVVERADGTPVWASGRVAGDGLPAMEYAGEPLEANQAYRWRGVGGGGAARVEPGVPLAGAGVARRCGRARPVDRLELRDRPAEPGRLAGR